MTIPNGTLLKWQTTSETSRINYSKKFLGTWEKINNPNFNYTEFGVIEQEAGVNRFIMSVGQWIERTGAISMVVRAGRYGGTYAHKDIAFHFAMWLSPEFQIYLINEFQRLKADENDRLKLEWNLQRTSIPKISICQFCYKWYRQLAKKMNRTSWYPPRWGRGNLINYNVSPLPPYPILFG
jgi:hypothetical protein